MKLPSLQQVVRESSAALRRFPLVLIAAFVWTVTVLILVDYEGPPSSSILFKVLYAASLGFPLLLAVNLVAERRRWPASRTWGVQGICAVLLVGYALTVPSYMPAAPEFHTERLLLLFLSMCLLGVVAPPLTEGSSMAANRIEITLAILGMVILCDGFGAANSI